MSLPLIFIHQNITIRRLPHCPPLYGNSSSKDFQQLCDQMWWPSLRLYPACTLLHWTLLTTPFWNILLSGLPVSTPHSIPISPSMPSQVSCRSSLSWDVDFPRVLFWAHLCSASPVAVSHAYTFSYQPVLWWPWGRPWQPLVLGDCFSRSSLQHLFLNVSGTSQLSLPACTHLPIGPASLPVVFDRWRHSVTPARTWESSLPLHRFHPCI